MGSAFLNASQPDVKTSLRCEGRLMVFGDREPEPEAPTNIYCCCVETIGVESPMICAGQEQWTARA